MLEGGDRLGFWVDAREEEAGGGGGGRSLGAGGAGGWEAGLGPEDPQSRRGAGGPGGRLGVALQTRVWSRTAPSPPGALSPGRGFCDHRPFLRGAERLGPVADAAREAAWEPGRPGEQ